MYHSKMSGFNIVDWTPFKRDIVKELAEACRKEGIRFCVYYSHRGVKDDPEATATTGTMTRQRKTSKYLREKSLPQLREL
jgi:alpha-L-fucosidase